MSTSRHRALPRRLVAIAAAMAALALLAGPRVDPGRRAGRSGERTALDTAARASGTTAASHIAVIVMENKEYSTIIGNAAAPYINGLANRFTLLTRNYAIRHPSLPNYLAMIGGSTFGITSDCTSCHVSATNLVDQITGRHLSWKAYMESLPYPCFTGASSGRYVKRHNPFMYFDDIRTNSRRCHRVVPLSQLSTDLANGAVPNFAWITPNVCHDMHDCSVATGDAWLATWVPKVLAGLGRGGILILTFDEGTSRSGCCSLANGGHIVTIIAGPGANLATKVWITSDQYSLLRLIEDNWGLPRLRNAACSCTPTLRYWRRPA